MTGHKKGKATGLDTNLIKNAAQGDKGGVFYFALMASSDFFQAYGQQSVLLRSACFVYTTGKRNTEQEEKAKSTI